jgi:glycosyltransferase involved in cell wall biosynthesis
LVPARNAAPWIIDSLRSILNQTYANLELIVVENRSTDQTPALIDELEDERIVHITQPTGDLVSALNAGLAVARGVFIVRQDADDLSHPRRIELQVDHLRRRPEVGLVGCDFTIMDLGGSELRRVVTPRTYEEICEVARRKTPFAGASIAARSKIFASLGGYDPYFDGRLGEDYDFILRALEICPAETVPEPLYFYRYNNPLSMCGLANYEYGPSLQLVRERAVRRSSPFFRKRS